MAEATRIKIDSKNLHSYYAKITIDGKPLPKNTYSLTLEFVAGEATKAHISCYVHEADIDVLAKTGISFLPREGAD